MTLEEHAYVTPCMSVAYQLIEEPEKALEKCIRAISVMDARIKRLMSSDAAAVEAMGTLAAGVDPLTAAKVRWDKLKPVLKAPERGVKQNRGRSSTPSISQCKSRFARS